MSQKERQQTSSEYNFTKNKPNIFKTQFHKRRNQTPINTLSQKETPGIFRIQFPTETVKFILKRSGDKMRRASLTNCRKWLKVEKTARGKSIPTISILSISPLVSSHKINENFIKRLKIFRDGGKAPPPPPHLSKLF